jgi:aminomuconate-semialdehyde/2-hydroxymuconate-6-semialdehyde dehydrogenase
VAALALEAGIPPGVINVVHGRGSVAGAALVRHPEVPAISFTGSTAVGQWIGREGGAMLKRLSLELGGKNAFVVFDDSDVDQAIATASRAAFSNQGQICLCGSRLLVQRSVFDRVVQGLAKAACELLPGDPLQDSTRFGSLISEAHLAKVAGMVDEARAAGASIVCGGARTPGAQLHERCRGGAFYRPTVVTGLDHSCRVVQEEIFGPVVTVHPFDDEEEAIALANGTRYGLAATVFTRDLSRAHRVASRLEAGIVWVNCWMVRDLRTPFGGVKQSGVGREGGDEALRFFTEPTNVCVAM